MYSFQSIEWVPIKDRGVLVTTSSPYDFDDVQTLKGQTVLIDGSEYECLGVEIARTSHGHVICQGKAFGILIPKENTVDD